MSRARDTTRVLAQSGHWRVARCRDDSQFIVERRCARAGAGSESWQSVAYVYASDRLQRVLERPSLGIPAGDRDRLIAALGAVREAA